MTTLGSYIDLQVNGYGGVDFNQDDLTAEGLRTACEAMRRDDVQAALGTIITDHVEVMCGRLARLVELRERDELARELITGIHIEGPFLNGAPGFRGAHPQDAIRPADVDAMKRLLDAAGGLTRIVTLAPENDPGMRVTRMLTNAGVTVSAGHCDPTLEQLDAAIDAGLSMFTHLGNGCPMQMHRHDNIVQRALSRADRLWLCFIADGVHVPCFALRNYLEAAGMDRCVIVSDAMAAAGLGPGKHTISRWEVEVGEDLCAWAPGRAHLLGSAMGIKKAVVKLREELGFDEACLHALTYANPLKAVGLAS